MSIIREVQRLIDEATAELSQLVRRGIVRLSTAAGFVQVAGYDGERFDDVELWQQFGLASRPPAGSEVMLAQVDAQGEQAIAFATHNRGLQPADLADGDAALYAKGGVGWQAEVRACADGSGYARVKDGKTLDLGGSTGLQYLLKGETVQQDIITFATGLTSATLEAHAADLVTAAASWRVAKVRAS